MISVRRITRRPVILAIGRFASIRNHYEVLGVKRSATTSEIRQAFLELSKKHHPDKQKGNAELFKQINEAYSVLSRENLRENYDASLASGTPNVSTTPPHPSDFDFWKRASGAHDYPFSMYAGRGRRTPNDGQASHVFFVVLAGFAALSYVISFFYFVRLSHASTNAYPLGGRYNPRAGRRTSQKKPEEDE